MPLRFGNPDEELLLDYEQDPEAFRWPDNPRYTKMTPEQQRIAIAQACGWTIETTAHFQILHNADGRKSGMCCGKHLLIEDVWRAGLEGDENGDHRFPNYLSDLNAMAEAEKSIPVELQGEYWVKLRGLNLGKPIYHFSAAQRAEAFLRTLNLWQP